MSLDYKELHNRTFESKLEKIYIILKGRMVWLVHENEVNRIYECNLLQDILNHYKGNKALNNHYSPIIHVCMNTRKGK